MLLCDSNLPRAPQHIIDRTGEADEFTGRLLSIYRRVLRDGVRQPLTLGIFRSDYMIDEEVVVRYPPHCSSKTCFPEPTNCPTHRARVTLQGDSAAGQAAAAPRAPRLRQIELNTISSAFAGLSPRVTALHDFLVSRHAESASLIAGKSNSPTATAGRGRNLPPNDATRAVASAIATSVDAYVAAVPEAVARAALVVAFVVQPAERNVIDQRAIEYELWENHRVRSVRATLAELQQRATLRESDGALLLGRGGDGQPLVDGDADFDEVAVVYYRCGYTPADYPSERGARVLLCVDG